MKTYTWKFNKTATKNFSKLDQQVQRRLIHWLDEHIEGSHNPRTWGKALEGDRGTFWRYRVGGFRIIADIQDSQFIVLVVKAAKRNDIYKN
ncbi:type II toxin-antitoxin system RelE family toxin [Loigolactobacillus zhaoyuanensis]|uniref:Type II toxin-antitoxin system RelE/ParE family toxin n=1 Tax=Loigolactobacillus zhaoyuanensis TaxID=2486017 RepID=A0ABW8UEZ7_9LACO|nr:type II toxin-antitoxin system RelE/ParE family toxin [Loigolactobacillus zhaoyuanensis]